MNPSDEQKVLIRLTNRTSEKLELKVVYSEAKTTSQGVIEYSENKELKMDAPRDYLFSTIVEGPDKITLKSKEVRDVELIVRMPQKKYDGFIAGGVEFIQELEKDTKKSSLSAQRSHLVGFRLSETDKKLPIDLRLEQPIVGTKNYKNAILMSLANQNANYAEGLTINAMVSKKGDSTILLETKMDQMRIAPNSILETPIYLDQALLDTGNYEIKVTATTKDNFHKEWNQDFKVTKKDVELLKENQGLSDYSQQKSLLWIAVGNMVILLSLVILLKKVKDKKDVKKHTH